MLNVGPTADGLIPPVQRQALEELGRWMGKAGPILRASSPVPAQQARPSDEPWVRWLATPEHLVAVVDAEGAADVQLDPRAIEVAGTGADGPTVLLLPRK